MTKTGHQQFWAWKWKFFPKKGHWKILVREIFFVPPTLRQVSAYAVESISAFVDRRKRDGEEKSCMNTAFEFSTGTAILARRTKARRQKRGATIPRKSKVSALLSCALMTCYIIIVHHSSLPKHRLSASYICKFHVHLFLIQRFDAVVEICLA